MPSTLLLRCQAPMQAWGVQSQFSRRDTLREPTRSGITGLLCAALGRGRNETLDDLAGLRMGVRVDQEGVVLKDFQTARNVMLSAGNTYGNVISNRFYLSDAVFLVGLETNNETQLERLQAALRAPVWLLFLGRRSFPPAKPIWLPDGLRYGQTLEFALQSYPFLLDEMRLEKAENLRVVIENTDGGILQQDMPVSFQHRTFKQRIQSVDYVKKPGNCIKEGDDVS